MTQGMLHNYPVPQFLYLEREIIIRILPHRIVEKTNGLNIRTAFRIVLEYNKH